VGREGSAVPARRSGRDAGSDAGKVRAEPMV
jgi:hypothetical protein